KEGNQYFYQCNEQRKHKGKKGRSHNPNFGLHGYQKSYQAHHHNVSCGYVRKQSDQKGKGLDQKCPGQFNNSQNRTDQNGNARHPQHVLPVILVSFHGIDDQCENRKSRSYCQLPCNVETQWGQSQKVEYPYKKEHCQQVTGKLTVFFISNIRSRYLVTDINHQRFQNPTKTCW